jgi:hypothetical protein
VVTLDAIAAAVLYRFGGSNAGSADFRSLAAGGCWYARADEQAASPYAVFTLDPEGDPKRLTDQGWWQAWALRVGVYTDQGRTGHDPGPLQAAVAACLPQTGWQAVTGGAVVHCLPRAPLGSFAPQLRAGRDVFLWRGQWQLLIGSDG